jgi:hypothetical protein
MIFCNFIIVSYSLCFKYTVSFVKLIPLWYIILQLTNVMPSAKANFTTPINDGLRKPKNVGGNREYLYYTYCVVQMLTLSMETIW